MPPSSSMMFVPATSLVSGRGFKRRDALQAALGNIALHGRDPVEAIAAEPVLQTVDEECDVLRLVAI